MSTQALGTVEEQDRRSQALARRKLIVDEVHGPDIVRADGFLAAFPQLARWYAQIGARPAVQRGMDVPSVDAPLEQRMKTAGAIVTR